MKKCFTIIFGILSLCLTYTEIYGQRKEISENEFKGAYLKALKQSQTLPHRKISERFVFGKDENKIRMSEKVITEFVSPENLRSLLQVSDEFAGKYSFEYVKYEGVTYQRRNEGEWLKKDLASSPNPQNSNNTSSDKMKYFLTENVKMDGQDADLFEFESEVSNRMKNPQTGEFFDDVSGIKQKYWIGKTGFLLKTELIEEMAATARIKSRRTEIYQYDPKIKIEVPTEALKSQ